MCQPISTLYMPKGHTFVQYCINCVQEKCATCVDGINWSITPKANRGESNELTKFRYQYTNWPNGEHLLVSKLNIWIHLSELRWAKVIEQTVITTENLLHHTWLQKEWKPTQGHLYGVPPSVLIILNNSNTMLSYWFFFIRNTKLRFTALANGNGAQN